MEMEAPLDGLLVTALLVSHTSLILPSEDEAFTFQGHPMDLFLKISVLQAHFCWLGDVEEIIVLGRKVLLGKR